MPGARLLILGDKSGGDIMVRLKIEGDKLVCEGRGWHKLWAFANRFEYPLAHARNVYEGPAVARGWWKGFRALGTHVPGLITAGMFYQGSEWVFWDVSDPDKAIVIELEGERLSKIIVEVENVQAAVDLLGEALASYSSRTIRRS